MNAPFSLPKAPGASKAWVRALETMALATRDPQRTLPRAVEAWAETRGERAAVIGETETLSYEALAARMNQYSRWALSMGVEQGETVALMMGNRPEYFAIWLGLIQIGAIVALVSPDLRGAGLAHAFAVAGAGRAIASTDGAEACAQALDASVEIWTLGAGAAPGRDLGAALGGFSGEPLLVEERRPVTLANKALRIFTSGTTGLPKAAEVSHRKLIAWTHWFAGLGELGPEHRHYNCLPMHHSVGGVVAMGAPLVNGGSVVVAEKFSARRFWDDIERFECTSFQYIGELCRYLVAAPPSAAEGRHKLRLALGNGLGAETWRAFEARFGPVRVLEFYASTEGNVWLYNVEGRVGAIGRAPPFMAARDSIALARFDADTQAPWRGEDGFCRRCEPGETGEALGRIGSDEATRFEGYSQASETEKKILRDVFAPGDAWMRTGDLMRRDADGFFSFVDRIGDTFRWKGENVATQEVAAALLACPGVLEAIVHGVAVPGADGKAGMATLRASGELDLADLAKRLETLPRPARPLFLRLASEIARTETFKPKRRLYAEEGFDVSRISDPLWVWDSERAAYVALDAARHEAIRSGALRL